MKLIKKITALFMALVISVAAVTVSASADTDYFYMNVGDKITYSFDDNTRLRFAFETEKSGEVTIKFNYTSIYFCCVLANINDDGETNLVKPYYLKASEGTETLLEVDGGSGFMVNNYDGGGCVCTVKYKLQKGFNLLTISNESDNKARRKGGNIGISISFKEPESTLSSLTLTLNKGDTIQLGSLMSDGTLGSAKWSSSKKSVATVHSNGKVTAKTKGYTVITASYKNKKLKIVVIVK